MHSTLQRPTRGRFKVPTLLPALGGTGLLGLWLGARVDGYGLLQTSLGLPLAVLFSALIMAPALYIGAAVVRAAPSPGAVLQGLARGLDDAGLALLGLLPAVMFLGATAKNEGVVIFVGLTALGGALLFGTRLLFGRVFPTPEARLRVLPVFGAWVVVSMGIGLMMLSRVLGEIA
jgi:hypothetical protein